MPEDDERPKHTTVHVVGEKLDDLSVADFDERIVILRAEIDRLELAKRLKQAAKDAAGSVFRS